MTLTISIFLKFVQFSFVTGFENEANYEIHDCEALPVTLTDEEANEVSPEENSVTNSGDLNTELVWCLNGCKEVGCQMVWFSNAI